MQILDQKKQRKRDRDQGRDQGDRSDSAEESRPRDEDKLSLELFFPEEMLEMIMARIPFPSLLKARLLTTSWNHKFSCQSEYSEDLDSLRLSNRLHRTRLQEEIGNISLSKKPWPTYCPVFLTYEGLRGYDRVSSKWKLLSSAWDSMFPDRKLKWNSRLKRWTDTTFGRKSLFGYDSLGPLLLVSWLLSSDEQSHQLERVVSVKNVMTGRLTKLCLELRPEKNELLLVLRLLPGGSNTSYRLFQSTRVRNKNLKRYELLTSVYDSQVGGWSLVTTSVDLPEFVGDWYHPLCDNSVYIHGKLYCLCVVFNTDPPNIGISFCINHVDSDKTWTVTSFPLNDRILEPDYIGRAGILLCSEKLVVFIYTKCHKIFIFDLDAKLLDLRERQRLVIQHGVLPETFTSPPPSDGFLKAFVEFVEYNDWIELASDHIISHHDFIQVK